MSNVDFEVQEHFQREQQRFEAALMFTKEVIRKGHGYESAIDRGIELADELLKRLDEI